MLLITIAYCIEIRLEFLNDYANDTSDNLQNLQPIEDEELMVQAF